MDLPLNARGQAQVAAIVKRLSDLNLDVIYASPCEPARSTATAIAAELGVPVKEIEELRNLNHGLWQGLPIDDVRRKYPKVFKQWQESPETICPPQGETVLEAVARIRKGLAKPLKKRKKPFGVVASEPLATLISCVILDRTPELPDPICGVTKSPLVEVLSPSGNGVAKTSSNGSNNGSNNGSDSGSNGSDSGRSGRPVEDAPAVAKGGNNR